MFRRGTLRFSSVVHRALITATSTTCLSAALLANAEDEKPATSIKENRILASKHRVALAEWPVIFSDPDKKHGVNTLDGLMHHLQQSGYDGIEMGFEHFESLYFKDTDLSKTEMIGIIKEKLDAANLRVFGILVHDRDEDWNSDSVDEHVLRLKQSLQMNKLLGAEYATFQIWLPDKYMMGDGSYRNDTDLLKEYVSRIEILQQICFEEGFNFYVETHVGRISEDPEAFVKVMDMSKTPFELNGDLSHYICRGMMKGPFVDRIIGNMEHTHVRMARIYGDLSINVEDPAADWTDPEGVTKTYWEFTKKGFQNGLSSRTIVGESGPFHLGRISTNMAYKAIN